MQTEAYIIGLIVVDKADGRSELCTVIGSGLEDDSLGAVRELTPELRQLLTEPGAVVADEAELGRLGFQRGGDVAEVHRPSGSPRRRRPGLKSLAAPYLFCSLETSRILFRGIQEDQTIFLLGRCRHAEEAAAVAERLRPDIP